MSARWVCAVRVSARADGAALTSSAPAVATGSSALGCVVAAAAVIAGAVLASASGSAVAGVGARSGATIGDVVLLDVATGWLRGAWRGAAGFAGGRVAGLLSRGF